MASIRASSNNSSASGTAISVSAPTGTTTGDVVICVVHGNGQTTLVDNNGSTPFTEDLNDYQPNTTNGHTVSVFSRRILAGDPSTYNFTMGTTNRWSIIAVTIKDPDATNIYDIAPSTANANNRDDSTASTLTAKTITTTTSNAIHFIWGGSDDGLGGSMTVPAGYTNQGQPVNEPSVIGTTFISPARATGAQTITATTTSPMITLSFAVYNTAISATNLTSFSSDTDATSYATSSISPSANKPILATVTSSKATTPDTPTLSGNGLTWVQIDTNNFDTVGTQRTITMFRAMGTSPTSGAVTASFAGTQTACVIIIDELSGTDTSGTNGSGAIVQSAKNAEASQAANTFTVTLAAFSSTNNATYGSASNGDTANFTAGTGFTSIGSASSATPIVRTLSEFRSDNDTTVDFGGSVGYTSGGIAVEIKAQATTTPSAVFMTTNTRFMG